MAIVTPSSDRIDVRAMLGDAGIDDVLERLDADLVGLQPVKQRIREIAALLVIERLRSELGITSQKPSLHMSFTGRARDGKDDRRAANGRDLAAAWVTSERATSSR